MNTDRTDGTDGTREVDEPAVGAEQVIRIAEHYHKAQRKHPCFADRLFSEERWRFHAGAALDLQRKVVGEQARLGYVEAYALLQCEMLEAVVAHLEGDATAARDELYDAIAVLLRMVDVIEGRQKLGKANAANGGAA